MFEIGQTVVTKSSGVCSIVDKEIKNFGIGDKEYLVLKPYFDNASSNSSLIYIPEDKADINMRGIMEEEQVLKLIDSMPTIEKIWYADPKIRRQKFEEIYKSGDLKSICQLLKSLYLQNQELKAMKKTLSMLDKEFMDRIKNSLYQEFAIALKIKPSEVDDFIESRIN